MDLQVKPKSKTTEWKYKLKESDPEKYRLYLEKDKETKRKKKESLEENWATGTRSALDNKVYYENRSFIVMETSDCIIEGLYLGGVMAALNEKDIEAKSVTHLLSLDEKPLPDAYTARFHYKHVFALDLYDFDLLSMFPECINFIDSAREAGGRILVHCQAGMSRSATVVIAYLMYKLKQTKQVASDHVRSRRHLIKPNEGFEEQLQLFETMGCQLNKSHSHYRAYQLSKLAIKFQAGQFSAGVPEKEIPSELFLEPDYSAKGKADFFKCRKCRLFLFHSGALTHHTTGEGESAFDWRSKVPANQWGRRGDGGGGGCKEVCKRSLFVDPLAWMRGKILEIQGKLHCPKCEAKVGSYVWYGEKCPCGAWVAPAFHIDSGKVDKIVSNPVMPCSRATPAQGSVTPSGRPLSYVPLQERPTSATTSSRGGYSPVAAVQPRMATVGAATMMRRGEVVGMATVSPLQTAGECEMEGDNQDLESGINSIHMDVDS